MDNLAAPWMAGAIASGRLAHPAPRDARIAWISHASLGAFVAAAAEHAVPGGRVFEVGGLEALTGDEAARRVGAAIGRPVRHEEAPLEGFAAGLNGAMGAPAGDDIADHYRHLFERPDALARGREAAARLGVTPEPMAAWGRPPELALARRAEPWQGATVPRTPSGPAWSRCSRSTGRGVAAPRSIPAARSTP